MTRGTHACNMHLVVEGRAGRIGEQLLLVLLYVITGGAGLALAIEPGNVTPVWPPSGLAMAWIVVRGPVMGRAVFAGALVLNALFYAYRGAAIGEIVAASAMIAAGSTAQALVGGALIRRVAAGRDALLTPRRAGMLFAVAFLACSLGASGGVAALLAFDRIPPAAIGSTWLTWWLGDLVGVVLVVPLVLAFVANLTFSVHALERALHWALVALVVELLFAPLGLGPRLDAPYLLLPPFVAIAYRLGPRDASAAAGLAYLGAAVGIAQGRSPTEATSTSVLLLSTDALLFSLFLPALVLASAEWDRRQKHHELRRVYEELEARVSARTSELERTNRELAGQVAERARTEARLRESDARLHAAVESLPFDFWMLDAGGRYLMVNSTTKRRWGDLTGHTLDDLDVAPDIVAEWRANNARALAGELVIQPTEYEREGQRRCFDAILSPVRVDGRIVGLLGINVDVTERVRLTENLQRAQKMESVGRLAGGIAHDFNNLLTVVTGAAELLVRRAAPRSSEAELAAQILDAAAQAAELTRRLLLFAGARPHEDRVAPLSTQLETALALLRPLLPESVELRVEQQATRAVRIDPTRLGQVVVNLAINARDAMPEGGVFTLQTYDADAADAPQQGWIDSPPRSGLYVVLDIADSGSGMSDEVRRLAFEPFFTTKGPRRGTGMGLASVHGIVRQAGGAIHLASAPGQGTRFRIYLPEAPPLASAALDSQRPALPSARARSATILLVEDEEAVRHTIARMLEHAGHRVHATHDADEARALIIREPIDLLVSDVVMPGLDGPSLARELRTLCPGLKVLFVSAYAGEQINDLGAPLIAKPCRSEELARAVATLLTERRPSHVPSAGVAQDPPA